ncbi:MAG: hypothetical protein A3B86_03205 [Candidatus Yanofskybacteria bacterium RIFCSPHIGHO2_02_FULL_38_22b]|uniref:Uncharacterized protein n=1 Tax=Candidatus Yanofskybacteria bacterium RIFCSPHIGHO2_02_FULL_38_22b TaxID=1802673 RepID=A0A1F8F4P3_9BACT|nr:MAG: hypothetical protein A2816_03425 [Candidatus Yanofskybacteria bacterium RIFCSPHIGHO2_01_FULL_39_44]OGN07216.1 MAG: hypothetical protein A3B86_03205 [Candidatus Yanofskybacteria bacterium RIFCSPHIGHO2_02_FULL_38_22b]OGN20095.1 MAG: hypothetical protein A2910_01165 [Candidatus Yanofskybacteria bacterium RIFCSPLOWO2_01_FULL_39_28]
MIAGLVSRVTTNPLYILGTIVIFQMVLNFNLPFWYGVGFLIAMSYLQNVSYGLQARAGTRSSNAFHLITAVLASFVFFATFRYLVRENMPLAFLATYMFGTIFGSLHGNIVSTWIENKIGARAEAPKTKPQLLRFWPSIVALLVVLALQLLFIPFSMNALVVMSLAILTLLDSFAFALLRLARSSDNYWFHGCTALFHIGVAFLKLAIMIKYQMDWGLFWPITTGSVIGSLTGQYYARGLSEWFKAGFDSHVSGSKKVEQPWNQMFVFSLGMVIHVMFFGFSNWTAVSLLLLYAFCQSISFAVVSRARQRNHHGYLLWSSVFSNGIWYLTMHQLALKNITPDKTAPYLVGNTVGSLVGQNVAMKAEKKLIARMDIGTA